VDRGILGKLEAALVSKSLPRSAVGELKLTNKLQQKWGWISGSQGGGFEDDYLLLFCTVWSRRNWSTFQICLFLPSSRRRDHSCVLLVTSRFLFLALNSVSVDAFFVVLLSSSRQQYLKTDHAKLSFPIIHSHALTRVHRYIPM
jgi:hypothetical protein